MVGWLLWLALATRLHVDHPAADDRGHERGAADRRSGIPRHPARPARPDARPGAGRGWQAARASAPHRLGLDSLPAALARIPAADLAHVARPARRRAP